MTIIFTSPLSVLISAVGEPVILLSSAILNPPFDPPVSLTHYLMWSMATVLLAGGLIGALALKQKGIEGLDTIAIIGDIVLMLSLILFSVYTVCMCVWMIRQYISFYRWMVPFN